MGHSFHIPVMLQEVVQALVDDPGGIYVDATVGGGGHAFGLLSALNQEGKLIGIDRDDEAIEASRSRLASFRSSVYLFCDVFWNLLPILGQLDISQIDGCLFDLGISSHQITASERGFSYRQDGPLDMRMDRFSSRTAATVVNQASEKELVRIFREYGEERQAVAIARRICSARQRKPIDRTLALRRIIASAASGQYLEKTLARIFQAIRIELNDELRYLKGAITDAVKVLRIGGKIAIISYHSLEDRIVKHTFRAYSHRCICPPDLPVCACGRGPVLKVSKDRTPCLTEVQRNPKARSARLRMAEKVGEVCDQEEG